MSTEKAARIHLGVIVAALACAILATAAPAAAADLADLLIDKMKIVIALILFAFISCQIGFVYLYAKLIGLPGGVFTSIMAGFFGLIAAVVIALPVAFVAIFLPQTIASILMTGVSMVGGGFGVKLAFGTDFNRGVLVYLMAVSTTTLGVLITLFIIF